MKVVLTPFGNGSSKLQRIELSSSGNFPANCVLGRNSATGLDQLCEHIQHVSRSHVMVKCREDRVFIDVVARQDHIVFLNGKACDRGEIEVHPGDELSLLGSLSYFNYKFEFSPSHFLSNEHTQEMEENQLPPTKRQKLSSDAGNTAGQSISYVISSKEETFPSSRSSVPLPVVTPQPAPQPVIESNVAPVTPPPSSSSSTSASVANPEKKIIEGLLRQYECEICYEVMACAFSLVPCGDCFCYSCIEDWASSSKKNCPHCNGEFDLKTSIPNKKIDNAIREVLKSDKEQSDLWEKRVEEGLDRRKKSLMEKPANAAAATAIGVLDAANNQAQRGNSILSHFRFTNPPSNNNQNNNNRSQPSAAAVPPQPAVPVPPAVPSASTPSRRANGRGANRVSFQAQPANNQNVGFIDLTKDSQPVLPVVAPIAPPTATPTVLVGNSSQLIHSFHELLLHTPVVAAIKTKELTDRAYSGICQHCNCMITTPYTIAFFPWTQGGSIPWNTLPYENRFRYNWNIYHASCIQQWNRFISQPSTPSNFRQKKINFQMINFTDQIPIPEQIELQRSLL